MNGSDPDQSDLDRATARRLSRLHAMPVDTSRLDAFFQSRIPRRSRFKWIPMPRLRATAAGIAVLLALVAGIVATTATRPALASAAQMAQFHLDLVADRIPVHKVDSLEEAARVLAAQSARSPDLPQAPEAHVMACCMKQIKNRKVACVLLRDAGTPITLSVASASDMRLPRSPTLVRDGVTYHTESFNDVNMISAEMHGRWVCLIGQVPIERLIDLAGRLQF